MALPDISRLCLHTITTKPWPLEVALDQYAQAGIRAISIWQSAIEDMGPVKAGDLVSQYPLDVISYVRGGFFPHPDPLERQKAVEKNLRTLEEAAALQAPLLVLVCGAHPDQSLTTSREQIRDGIEAIIPFAQQHKVKLGIEPLHPMYADSRSAIVNIKQALDMVLAIDSPIVGVVLDVYHIWWDDALKAEIDRCGQHDRLFAFHVCDWKSPTEDMLLDRGLMGEGCIDIPSIRKWTDNAGFNGYIEVEIFSNIYWQMDQTEFLHRIIDAYLHHC